MTTELRPHMNIRQALAGTQLPTKPMPAWRKTYAPDGYTREYGYVAGRLMEVTFRSRTSSAYLRYF